MRAASALISLIAVVCITSLPAVPPLSVPLEVDDEVVALAATSSRAAPLVLLARRGVALVERSAEGWVVAAHADLTPFIAAGARLARRPLATLEVLAGYGDASAPGLRIHAAALGLPEPLELRRTGAEFTRVEATGEVPGASAGPALPAPNATLGRALEWRPERGEPVSFHLDAERALVASLATGEPLDRAGAVGELLAVLPAERGEASVLVSSPSLPAEPDRILEFRLRDGRLIAARRSHEFAGRLAAVVRIEAGRDLVAVAVVDRPGHSRVHLVPEDDLWKAP